MVSFTFGSTRDGLSFHARSQSIWTVAELHDPFSEFAPASPGHERSRIKGPVGVAHQVTEQASTAQFGSQHGPHVLNFMVPVARENVKQICIATSPQALKDAPQQAKDVGADDVLPVPTISDPAGVHA